LIKDEYNEIKINELNVKINFIIIQSITIVNNEIFEIYIV